MPSLNGFFPPLPPLSAQFYSWELQVSPILHVLAGEQVAHSLHTKTLGAGGVIWEVDEATVMAPCLCHHFLQEKRRAERAEQQRIRAEKEKERQARLAVSVFVFVSLSQHHTGGDLMLRSASQRRNDHPLKARVGHGSCQFPSTPYPITFPAVTLVAGGAVGLPSSNVLLCAALHRRKRHAERRKMPRERLRMISRRRRLCPPWVPHTAAIWQR